MNIGIIGVGQLGATLGTKWVAQGHKIRYGIRSLNSPRVQRMLLANIPEIEVDTIESAIQFGDVLVLAIPAASMKSFMDANHHLCKSKLILDPSSGNGNAFVDARNAYMWANIYGFEHAKHPLFGDIAADAFYCGYFDDRNAIYLDTLILQLGLRPLCVGGVAETPLLRALHHFLATMEQAYCHGNKVGLKMLY